MKKRRNNIGSHRQVKEWASHFNLLLLCHFALQIQESQFTPLGLYFTTSASSGHSKTEASADLIISVSINASGSAWLM